MAFCAGITQRRDQSTSIHRIDNHTAFSGGVSDVAQFRDEIALPVVD